MMIDHMSTQQIVMPVMVFLFMLQPQIAEKCLMLRLHVRPSRLLSIPPKLVLITPQNTNTTNRDTNDVTPTDAATANSRATTGTVPTYDTPSTTEHSQICND
mmetsp:Transcript_59300/g.70753  ORF Transcript_59300/g.70753 Transcript_59300/m.70753 type:complete len:102 (+) Transcript_59300:53-358(+)